MIFIRSSLCIRGDCVEVALDGGTVLVRDSAQPDGPVLRYSFDDWRTHVLGEIRDGGWLPEWSYRRDDESYVIRRLPAPAPRLVFAADEWDAFVEGVQGGEFDVERLATGTAQDPSSDGGDTESVSPAPDLGSTATSGASNDASDPIAEEIQTEESTRAQ